MYGYYREKFVCNIVCNWVTKNANKMLHQRFAFYKFEILEVFSKTYLQNDMNNSQKPRKNAARHLGNTSLENSCFAPWKVL